MPATPTRIGFISEQFRKAISQSVPVQTRHGSLARETDDPVETFFDNQADAQIIADARQALLGAERRRFRVTAQGTSEALALAYVGAVPVAQYVDPSRSADMPALSSEIIIDLARDTCAFTVWG